LLSGIAWVSITLLQQYSPILGLAKNKLTCKMVVVVAIWCMTVNENWLNNNYHMKIV